ncbi:MAG TPA: hypothetical protein PLS82_04700 [Phycisphaerae bacterium]|nr:hypothetical protein [Phycisphaerae bacterium]
MNVWKRLVCLVAVALLSGTAYAADSACCSPGSEVRTEMSSEEVMISGTPCAPCAAEAPCKPRRTRNICNLCGLLSPKDKCDACAVKCCKTKADIERLHASNPKCTTDLCVRYKVEVDCPTKEYDLIVQIKCEDQIIYERVVALENGQCDKGGRQLEFYGEFTDCLPQMITSRRGIRVEGNVVARGTTISLDRERERLHRSSTGHGLATPLYAAGDVMYTPVRWMTGS